MTDFMLIFRSEDTGYQPTPEEFEAQVKVWQDWIGGIAAQGKFNSTNMLAPSGKVLRQGGVVTDGPFVEIKEQLGGYLLLKAENIEEAITFAHGCPVLQFGGNVEVRPIVDLSK